jgi:N-acetylglucosaminyldiphosphoundecaprenol N-acetyl-beta-D-mannosaminyltransferase
MNVNSSLSGKIFDATRKRVVSIDLSLLTYQEALNNVIELGKSNTPSYVCFSNVHMTMEASASPDFQKIVNSSTYSFADGMPLVFALRILYGIRQDRIAGMDFMLDALRMCDEKRLSVFLFGSTPEVLESLSRYVHLNFPRLQLAGILSPPFRTLTEVENNAIIDQINSSGANLVFVGLGCPKQEIWMEKNSSRINACLLGVGGAFEIYAGVTKRAPVWMRNSGLEWAYRLFKEPRRLFKRYAITNFLFLFSFAKQFISTNQRADT